MSAAHNDSDVEIQQLQPQPVVSIRAIVRMDQLGDTMGDRLQALWAHLQQHGAEPAGPPFVRYHTFEERDTDMELGFPVAQPVAGEGRVGGGELPGGAAAIIWDDGSHDRLGDAYSRMQRWMAAHGREPDSASWEVYHWIDLSQEPDPTAWPESSTWRTQLVQPIR